MIEAIEFQASIKDGLIQIPDAYQTDLVEGMQVKVIVIKQQQQQLVRDFKALLEETQTLPQAQAITEEEIAAEIAAYRAGQ